MSHRIKAAATAAAASGPRRRARVKRSLRRLMVQDVSACVHAVFKDIVTVLMINGSNHR